jgi:hypothetical protein
MTLAAIPVNSSGGPHDKKNPKAKIQDSKSIGGNASQEGNSAKKAKRAKLRESP